MVNALLNGILNFVMGLVNVLLLPLDTLIQTTIPGFVDVLNYVEDLISMLLGFIPWILSWFNFPMVVITWVASYFIAKFTLTLLIHPIKLALAWWRTLKL